MGIEPTTTAWEAVVLPLNYIRKYYNNIIYQTKFNYNYFFIGFKKLR